jgi:hypothetical protein
MELPAINSQRCTVIPEMNSNLLSPTTRNPFKKSPSMSQLKTIIK